MTIATKFPNLTEEQFLRQVLALAKLHKWRSAHFRPAMSQRGNWRTAVQGDGVGFPDLLLLREGKQIVCELKVGRNKPTQEQSAWLAAFQYAGVPAYVFTPADWPEIERILTAKA